MAGDLSPSSASAHLFYQLPRPLGAVGDSVTLAVYLKLRTCDAVERAFVDSLDNAGKTEQVVGYVEVPVLDVAAAGQLSVPRCPLLSVFLFS